MLITQLIGGKSSNTAIAVATWRWRAIASGADRQLVSESSDMPRASERCQKAATSVAGERIWRKGCPLHAYSKSGSSGPSTPIRSIARSSASSLVRNTRMHAGKLSCVRSGEDRPNYAISRQRMLQEVSSWWRRKMGCISRGRSSRKRRRRPNYLNTTKIF